MKTIEPMYDIIFKDEELKTLFLNFHGTNWNKLDVEKKNEVVEAVNDRLAKLYGYTKPKIVSRRLKEYGHADSLNWKLVISRKSLEKDMGYETLDTIFHELRHFFQHRATENRLTDKEYASEEDKKNWQDNWRGYLGGNHPHYKFQYVERDAWSCAMLLIRKVYFMNKETLGVDDPNWETYCDIHRDVITNFISESEESKTLIESTDKEIREIWKKNNEDMEQYNLGKQIVETLMKKKFEIDNCNYYQMAVLFSPYCYRHLDNRNKIKLLNKYREYLKLKRCMIVENSVNSVSINKQTFVTSAGVDLLNNLLTRKYLQIGDEILKDVYVGEDLTQKEKDEIKLNLYRDVKGKKINFVKDIDNLFVFSLQPYAKYESYYILNEMHKIRDIEKKIFNKNHKCWENYDNFYDNNAIYKMASRVMGIPFEEYYANLLEQYKKNIIESIKSFNPNRKG